MDQRCCMNFSVNKFKSCGGEELVMEVLNSMSKTNLSNLFSITIRNQQCSFWKNCSVTYPASNVKISVTLPMLLETYDLEKFYKNSFFE